jgi:hypothetical protein
MDVTEKKSPRTSKKAADKTPPDKPAAAEQPAKAEPATPVAPPPVILGPGVLKRPKRDPAALPLGADEVKYTPSEQVFRRRS